MPTKLEELAYSRVKKIVAVKAGGGVHEVDPQKFLDTFPDSVIEWESERGVWNSAAPVACWVCFTIYLKD